MNILTNTFRNLVLGYLVFTKFISNLLMGVSQIGWDTLYVVGQSKWEVESYTFDTSNENVWQSRSATWDQRSKDSKFAILLCTENTSLWSKYDLVVVNTCTRAKKQAYRCICACLSTLTCACVRMCSCMCARIHKHNTVTCTLLTCPSSKQLCCIFCIHIALILSSQTHTSHILHYWRMKQRYMIHRWDRLFVWYQQKVRQLIMSIVVRHVLYCNLSDNLPTPKLYMIFEEARSFKTNSPEICSVLS